MRIKSEGLGINILIGDLLFVLVIVLIIVKHGFFPFQLFFILPGIMMLSLTVSTCKSITLSKDGCCVRFLMLKRFYSWDELKYKRIHNVGTANVMITSSKMVILSKYKYNGAAIKLFGPTKHHISMIHPFAFNYFFLVESKNYENIVKHSCGAFPADEDKFMSLMKEYGVELEDLYIES